MRLIDKVVVPELSASAHARVERQLIDAVGRGEGEANAVSRAFAPGFGKLAIAVALGAVVIAGGINLRSALESRGDVTSAAQATSTEISTSADAVTMRLGDSTIEIGPNSELVLLQNTRGDTGVALRRGSVNCTVEPIENRRPFWVGASDVTVRVVGTVFSVAHDPAAPAQDQVQVDVERGRVAVSNGGDEVMVSAGSQWSARDGVTQAIARFEPPAATDSETASSVGDHNEEVVVAGDPAKPAASAAKKNVPTPNATASAPRREPKKNERSGKLPRPRRMSAPSGDAELLAAMELETSDPREAIRVYSQIASRARGARASFALYSRAYVQVVRLGERSAGLRTLELFHKRFPKARESESALWLQIRSLCSGGQRESCRTAAHRYKRRFASGRFANAAQKIIDSL